MALLLLQECGHRKLQVRTWHLHFPYNKKCTETQNNASFEIILPGETADFASEAGHVLHTQIFLL